MSEVVMLNLAIDLTVATVKTRQPRNFKWDEETDLIFLQSVQGNKTYIKSADKLELKWQRVLSDLSKSIFILSLIANRMVSI